MYSHPRLYTLYCTLPLVFGRTHGMRSEYRCRNSLWLFLTTLTHSPLIRILLYCFLTPFQDIYIPPPPVRRTKSLAINITGLNWYNGVGLIFFLKSDMTKLLAKDFFFHLKSFWKTYPQVQWDLVDKLVFNMEDRNKLGKRVATWTGVWTLKKGQKRTFILTNPDEQAIPHTALDAHRKSMTYLPSCLQSSGMDRTLWARFLVENS